MRSWWWEYSFFIILGVAGVVIAVVTTFAILADEARADRFMQNCLQDRKAYECEAMWRAGNSNTVIVPLVMPVLR